MDNMNSNKYFDLYLGFCQDWKKWVWPIRTPRECCLSILLSHIILQYRESRVILKQSNLRIGCSLSSKMVFYKMSVCIRWRENHSVDFNQTCSKHINYANKDTREGFLKNFENQSCFWAIKTPKQIELKFL